MERSIIAAATLTWYGAVLLQVTFARAEKIGTLTVDNDEPVTFNSRGKMKTIEVTVPYYLGGLPKTVAASAGNNLEVRQKTLR